MYPFDLRCENVTFPDVVFYMDGHFTIYWVIIFEFGEVNHVANIENKYFNIIWRLPFDHQI